MNQPINPLSNVEAPLALLNRLNASDYENLAHRVRELNLTSPTPSGLTAAGDPSPSTLPAGAAGDELAAKTWASALRQGSAHARLVVDRLQKQLTLTNRIEVGGQITSALGSSGVLALIAGGAASRQTIIAAVIAFCATVATLLVSFGRIGPTGKSRREQVDKLLPDVGQATALAIQFDIFATTPMAGQLDAQLTDAAKDLVAKFAALPE